MEISQKAIDSLEQRLGFLFPNTAKNIFQPTYKDIRGGPLDPVIAGITRAAEKEIYPYILQSFVNTEKASKIFEHKGEKDIPMFNTSVLGHVLALISLLIVYEFRNINADSGVAGGVSLGALTKFVMEAVLSAMAEYDSSIPNRTQ